MAAAAILVFEKLKILTICPLQGTNLISMPNFVKIGQTVAEIWRFNGFFKMAASAILDLSGVYWDHPRRLLGSLYRCAKFGLNRCSTIDNMKVLIFCACGLKTPIYAPKIVFLGGFYFLRREQY